ncbi:hypothetical protein ACFQ07_07000, partial [Actinomadura adrarensis]
ASGLLPGTASGGGRIRPRAPVVRRGPMIVLLRCAAYPVGRDGRVPVTGDIRPLVTLARRRGA